MNPSYVLLAVLLAIHATTNVEAVVNGHDVKPHSAPYAVFIRTQTSQYTTNCTGSLISHQYVLVVRECVIDVQNISIHLGAHDKRIVGSNEIKTWTTDVIRGDGIALIKLREPIHFNNVIQPVKLPSRRDVNKTYAGQQATVYGWGVTGFYVTDYAHANQTNVLRSANVTVISNVICDKQWDGPDGIYKTDLCTSGSQNITACNGDIGGPLVINGNTQIGITKDAQCFAGYNFPTVYVRITEFLDWIQKNSDVIIN